MARWSAIIILMTKKKKLKKENREQKDTTKNTGLIQKIGSLKTNIKEETRYGIWVVICFVLALFFILSAFEKAGPVGKFFHNIFKYILGVGFFLLPFGFTLLGLSFIKNLRPKKEDGNEKRGILFRHTLGMVFFVLSGLGLVEIWFPESGGIWGGFVGNSLMFLFEIYASVIILVAIFIISLFIIFDKIPNILGLLKRIYFKKPETEESGDNNQEVYGGEEIEGGSNIITDKVEATKEEGGHEKIGEESAFVKDFGMATEEIKPIKVKLFKPRTGNYTYAPPPLSLLERDSGKPNVGDIKSNSNIIKRTLSNFGIEVEMDEITIGPSVTRYALKPAEGVKLSKILTLKNNLSLALAAHPLRIEAPIPGKSLVGIEVPNRSKSTVGLATLLADDKFISSPKPLTVALGKNIAGRPTFYNIPKMPHALIAGTTGSGKSVTIHAIINSLLYKNGPDMLRFIMIDPKRVELTLYKGIPHLLTPTITDPKKAILSLKWSAKEMERRYNILEQEGVRNIDSYHNKLHDTKWKNIDGEEADPMPFIVIVMDELADIMATYPRELEACIVRIAQMAVSSQIDSRTILDASGAETLLGAGDMLWMAGEMSQPERLQSAFISEDEVKKVVKFIKDNNPPLDGDINEIELAGSIETGKNIFESDVKNGDDDELYEEAREAVMEAGKASTSYLQRKLKVGYSRAARLIDILEERGIVGPGDGAKPREVLDKTLENEYRDAGAEFGGDNIPK